MQKKHLKFLLKHCKSLENQTVVLTGATGGIGKAITIHLLNLNANVILAVLDLEDGKKLKAELSHFFDASKITVLKLDVANFNSINQFIENIKDKNINHLINNAGVLHTPEKNGDYEMHYVINFLGHTYLSLMLAEQLNKNADSRVVFQSSLAYHFTKIRWDDPQGMTFKRNVQKYAHAKRLINQFVVAINQSHLKNYPNVSFRTVHPGLANTALFGSNKNAFTRFIKKTVRFLAKFAYHSTATAALPAVIALTHPKSYNKIIGPRCFGIWGKPKAKHLKKILFNPAEIQKANKLLQKELNNINKTEK